MKRKLLVLLGLAFVSTVFGATLFLNNVGYHNKSSYTQTQIDSNALVGTYVTNPNDDLIRGSFPDLPSADGWQITVFDADPFLSPWGYFATYRNTIIEIQKDGWRVETRGLFFSGVFVTEDWSANGFPPAELNVYTP